VIYLHDAQLIDWRTLGIRDCHLAVEEGADGGVSVVDDIPEGADVIDCGGRFVTRALAVGHHHVYSALARGMPPPSRTPTSFVEILELVWWNLDKCLDEPMIRASALAVAVEAALCGATFVIDHHSSPSAADGSLHAIAAAFDEVGVSHLLCYELSDRDGPDRLRAGFEETEAYLADHQGLVGLHASFTVSDELLDRAVQMARSRRTGVHIHVAEALSDEEHCLEHHGKSIVARLADAGALELESTILAHCLHLDDAERAQLRDTNAWVVQNSESNQHNGVGRFDPRGMSDRLFLGTDGMHSDMFASCRAAYLDGQSVGGMSPLDAYRRLHRVHDYLQANGFRGDGDNNLVVLDYATPTPVTAENWPAHVVYALSSRNVHAVLSSGRCIVEDGRIVTVDHDKVLSDARQQATRLWGRL